MKRDLQSFDYLLIILVIMLVGFGIVMIGSATHGKFTEESIKQLIFFGLGLVLMLLASFIDYHIICKFYIVIYIFSIMLLVAVLVYGYFVIGDKDVWRWFDLGFFKVQPSEFAKLFQVIFLATFLEKNSKKINDIKVLSLTLAIIALPVVLIFFQPSLTAGIVLLFISLSMLFVSDLKFRTIAIAMFICFGLILLLYLDVTSERPLLGNILEDYQVRKIETFFNPASNKDAFYQTGKSLQAIATGKFSGKGIYNGYVTQFSNLPEAHNDFIFSVIAEECGFIGCIITLAVVLFIIVKAILIAQFAVDLSGRFICVGVAAMLAFQIFVNVSVTMGLIPNTGMPFPFVSYGGSSLWVCMVSIGLVNNVKMTKTKSMFEG